MLYIIEPDDSLNTYEIGKYALCGILCNGSILAVGTFGEILFFNLSNPN